MSKIIVSENRTIRTSAPQNKEELKLKVGTASENSTYTCNGLQWHYNGLQRTEIIF
jgi:hypothetical protein